MTRVGQNHIYTVYIRYSWQGNHQIYGHIRCIYTVLADPTNLLCVGQRQCQASTYRCIKIPHPNHNCALSTARCTQPLPTPPPPRCTQPLPTSQRCTLHSATPNITTLHVAHSHSQHHHVACCTQPLPTPPRCMLLTATPNITTTLHTATPNITTLHIALSHSQHHHVARCAQPLPTSPCCTQPLPTPPRCMLHSAAPNTANTTTRTV